MLLFRAWLAGHRPANTTTASSLVVQLMLFATYALALTAAVAVVLEIVLLWSAGDHGVMVDEPPVVMGDEPSLEPAMLEQNMPQLELNVSEPALSQQEAENGFLELAPPPGLTQRRPAAAVRKATCANWRIPTARVG